MPHQAQRAARKNEKLSQGEKDNLASVFIPDSGLRKQAVKLVKKDPIRTDKKATMVDPTSSERKKPTILKQAPKDPSQILAAKIP